MSENEITINEWNNYLDDLYHWVQEKYDLFDKGEIDQDQYNEHLQYYMKEKDRIEKIIDSIQHSQVDMGNNSEVQPKEGLNQAAFEEFFGVKLEQELQEIDEEKAKQKSKDVDDFENDENIEEEVWKYVGINDKGGFDTSDSSESDEDVIKMRILLIGDSAVGRTSLRRAWMGKHFVESHLTTIGASIESKIVTIDNTTYEVALTDLGGQDFYSGLRRNFYRNVDGAIVVFDLTRPNTFRRLDFWIKEMYRELKTLVPFILVGNKKDHVDRKIDEKYGVRASAQFSRTTLPKFRVRYMETSAKTGENVDEIFETICLEVRDLQIKKG